MGSRETTAGMSLSLLNLRRNTRKVDNIEISLGRVLRWLLHITK